MGLLHTARLFNILRLQLDWMLKGAGQACGPCGAVDGGRGCLETVPALLDRSVVMTQVMTPTLGCEAGHRKAGTGCGAHWGESSTIT